MVVETLLSIATNADKQVLITTHVPGLASHIPVESLRFIRSDSTGKKYIENSEDNGDEFIMRVANDLGVLPNIGAKVALCVEGKYDIDFIMAMNKVLLKDGEKIIDLEHSDKVAVIGMGGSALKDWVNREYLKKLSNMVHEIKNVEKIEFLPYHKLGSEKYKKLGIADPYDNLEEMDREECKNLYNEFMKIHDKKLAKNL